jgi:hypothetical protein
MHLIGGWCNGHNAPDDTLIGEQAIADIPESEDGDTVGVQEIAVLPVSRARPFPYTPALSASRLPKPVMVKPEPPKLPARSVGAPYADCRGVCSGGCSGLFHSPCWTRTAPSLLQGLTVAIS